MKREVFDHDFLGLSIPVEYGGGDTSDFRFKVVERRRGDEGDNWPRPRARRRESTVKQAVLVSVARSPVGGAIEGRSKTQEC
ncbi:MAG: hypothetical protein BGO11_11600 [Solirubrobacterales bacterium 70-9]|nr:MAG: hypothetical protein BGO11_11600 [Solirubrobacterales bacterium 70-9]